MLALQEQSAMCPVGMESLCLSSPRKLHRLVQMSCGCETVVHIKIVSNASQNPDPIQAPP